MIHAARRRLKWLSFVLFSLGQRLGVNIMPKHYYVQVADIHELARTRQRWAKPSKMVGIDMGVERQVAALLEMVSPFQNEYRGNPHYKTGVAGGFGPGYGYIEAQALHGMIRHLKPKRIVEVGSGVSTHCMLEAIKLNVSPTELTCIEPNPKPFLRAAPVNLIEAPVQVVDIALFDTLEGGDLLFIDSSHSIAPGGDVLYLLLEVLPRLMPGVIVHIHDINLPYNYKRDVLKTYIQSGETALLQAYLIGNSQIRTIFCLSQLHYEAPELMKKIFPEYVGQPSVDGLVTNDTAAFQNHTTHFPSAIYLEVMAGDRNRKKLA